MVKLCTLGPFTKTVEKNSTFCCTNLPFNNRVTSLLYFKQFEKKIMGRYHTECRQGFKYRYTSL